jgi:hypothetical protein
VKIISKILFCFGWLPSALLAADSFTVSAQIDGHSQLIIKPDQVYWQHLLYARPGRHLTNLPTLLSTCGWFPQWPDANDSGPARSASLPVTASLTTNITLAKELGRGSVEVVQQPTMANGYTLVIDFNDWADGPDRYTVVVSGASLIASPLLTTRIASIALCFATESNRLYQLQYSSTLASNTWFDLAPPIHGYGTNACFIDPVLEAPRRFYRVVPLP